VNNDNSDTEETLIDLGVEVEESEEENDEKPVKNFNKYDRTLTNEDILKYEPMVEKYIRDNVAKNWNEANTKKGQGDNSLGNTGMSLNDIRQHLRTEVCIALYNYNPNYRTKEGRSVKESTFVFQHLFNRTGQMMKRLTKKRYGYGVWHANIEETLWEHDSEK
jgi:hypothetical protein